MQTPLYGPRVPETPPENSWLKRRIAKGYISRDGIWTSGRKCNFDSQCNRADFYPLLVNGWFWSAVAEKIKPTDNSLNGDWSDTGATGRPQPDNYEALEGGDEGCLAILNNFYNDGIKWHDAAFITKSTLFVRTRMIFLRVLGPTAQGTIGKRIL
ncbi:hypothetical protein Ocin01_17615 [Orchesella cincta]|uniref:Uncharacterized protein n=1 Tax=Orchesella cincta TaxID=48709 RepID=A0A1D2M7W0_ORCCI|nr:hypothetical protein Ocin01_17615 [Orchesella cincta]